ncbi:hypothetical protein CDL15_Pgr020667 [Punica granatum]|uniref:Uncharacterized protein n=1 Tax=Punica granatum TaxID=22663 RepID=A0A218XMJ2_PUNGR|nr:hypothetical protein CDL15_Pgr020667 [Punica granatum]
MWTRSPESCKDGLEVLDTKSGSSKYRGCYAVGTRWLVSIAICRTIKNLLDNGIRYAVVKALNCRRLVPLLGRLPICWGCLGLVMWDSSSGVERLLTLRDLESESAVVPAFVVPVILTSLVNHGITSDFGEGSICPEVSLDLGGDACVDVEWFVQLSLSPASWGVPIRRTTPSSKYEERVRDEFSRRCEPVYRSLPVTGVSL